MSYVNERIKIEKVKSRPLSARVRKWSRLAAVVATTPSTLPLVGDEQS